MATALVCLVIGIWVALAIRKIIKDKKEGKACSGCSGGSCQGCSKKG